METFGIIAAMDEELMILVDTLKSPSKSSHSSMIFYNGVQNGRMIVCVKSGLGKVNAAVCSQLLITKFNVNKIILTGVAGALDSALDVGDIVISKDCVQWDFDTTALGSKPGEIYGTNMRFFNADKLLVSSLASSAKQCGINYKIGRIITGDSFVTDRNRLAILNSEYAGICVEMEGAAVGQVCQLNNIPFAIIRSISDKADGSAGIDFNNFLNHAAKVSSSILINFMEGQNGFKG